MVRMSLPVFATLLAMAGAIPVLAAPIAQPGLAPAVGEAVPGFERAAYDAPRRPYCKLESQRHFYNWNPGRYDTWNGMGPYKHKHFGGHRWHDLNYNGCAPWWQRPTRW